MSLIRKCHHRWCCAPWWFRGLALTVFFIAEFPLVHTFWNIVGFEGFYANE